MIDDKELEKARAFLKSEDAKVLLLTCIDHRIQAQIPALMDFLGYDVKKKEYDQTIWNSMGVGPYEARKEPERHAHYVSRLAQRVRERVKTVKPHFFVAWLLFPVSPSGLPSSGLFQGATLKAI